MIQAHLNINNMKTATKLLAVTGIVSFGFSLVQPAHAQTLAKNGAWLEKQFNQLTIDDDKDKDENATFRFRGCQINMDVDSKDKDVSVGVNMAWQLKDVRKVSYKKNKDGQYTLLLDVPADKVKMAMNLGGFGGSFNTDGKDKDNKDNTTSLTFNTKDESLIKQIKQKLEESVQLCRQGKN